MFFCNPLLKEDKKYQLISSYQDWILNKPPEDHQYQSLFPNFTLISNSIKVNS